MGTTAFSPKPQDRGFTVIKEREAKVLATQKGEALEAWQTFTENNQKSPFSAINKAGADRIEVLGFPHTTHEIFSYVNTMDVSGSYFAPNGGEEKKQAAASSSVLLQQSVVTITSGDFDETATDISAHYGAVTATPLNEVVGDPEVEKRIKKSVSSEKDVFAAMNSAFLAGGARVTVKDGKTLKAPLLISIMADVNSTISPRVMVDIGANSSATIIIRTTGVGIVNSMIDILARQGSATTLYHYNEGVSEDATFAKQSVTQQKDSVVTFVGVTTGGHLTRASYDWRLQESGAEVSFANLTLTDGDQKAHHYARFYHEAPDCKSDVVWRNIIGGESLVSVDGTVIVEKGAMRTDSDQQIKNLMLTGEAKANSKPNLMIFNDDVKCSHGDTVGQVNDAELLYFQSRGIEKSQARAILTRSFANSVTEKIAYSPLADEIVLEINARLGG